MPASNAKKTPSFVLRPVAPPDEGFLRRLYATTRSEELARTGWDAARQDEFIRDQYLARRASHAARFAGAEHAVIVINGRDAGMWMVHRAPGEIRLVNIELLPEHRGQGVGTALLQQLAAEAKTCRIPLVLSVREENRAATRLYRRLGFQPIDHRDGYLAMRYQPRH